MSDPASIPPVPLTMIHDDKEPRGVLQKIAAEIAKPFERKAEVTLTETPAVLPINSFYPPPPGVVDVDDVAHNEPSPTSPMVTPELADGPPPAADVPVAVAPEPVPQASGADVATSTLGAPLYIASKDGVQAVNAPPSEPVPIASAPVEATPSDAVRAQPTPAPEHKADLPIEQPGTPDPAHPPQPPTLKERLVAAVAPLHTHRTGNSGGLLVTLATVAHLALRVAIYTHQHTSLATLLEDIDTTVVMPTALGGGLLAYVGKSPVDVRPLR